MDFISKINILHFKRNNNSGAKYWDSSLFSPHRDVVLTCVCEAPADSKLLVSYGGLWDCKGDEISPPSAA